MRDFLRSTVEKNETEAAAAAAGRATKTSKTTSKKGPIEILRLINDPARVK